MNDELASLAEPPRSAHWPASPSHEKPASTTKPTHAAPSLADPSNKARTSAPSSMPKPKRTASTPSSSTTPAHALATAITHPTPDTTATAPPSRAKATIDRPAQRTRGQTVEADADPTPPSIDGELELLGAAQAALQSQKPSRALSLLQEHAFRFPTGALIEERLAMQALSLCALQRRSAARSVLASLEARGSKSQLLPRIRTQCGL
jgi:hypothetical protein